MVYGCPTKAVYNESSNQLIYKHDSSTCCYNSLIAVMVGLEGALAGNTQVLGLVLGKVGQLHACK